MEPWFTASPWPGLIFWSLIYLSDYWMTIRTARMYGANPHFEFEGSLELTPQFQKDVDALRLISGRHLLMLALTDGMLLVLWWLFAALDYTQGFGLVLGMFILTEAAVHMRHFRSYFMLQRDRAEGGMSGTLSYRRWVLMANSAFEFFSFAMLFLFTASMTRSLFFLGGGLSCLSLALNHYRKSRRLYEKR